MYGSFLICRRILKLMTASLCWRRNRGRSPQDARHVCGGRPPVAQGLGIFVWGSRGELLNISCICIRLGIYVWADRFVCQWPIIRKRIHLRMYVSKYLCMRIYMCVWIYIYICDSSAWTPPSDLKHSSFCNHSAAYVNASFAVQSSLYWGRCNAISFPWAV